MISSFTGKYRFLSNFYEQPVIYKEEVYPTVEHAYQAAKATNEKDRQRIKAVKTPGVAKRLGRHINIRRDWENVKISIMREILQSKFSNEDLKRRLLNTGDVELVEGNTWNDRFWGQCPVGTGFNVLGSLLMQIRDEFKKTAIETVKED